MKKNGNHIASRPALYQYCQFCVVEVERQGGDIGVGVVEWGMSRLFEDGEQHSQGEGDWDDDALTEAKLHSGESFIIRVSVED